MTYKELTACRERLEDFATELLETLHCRQKYWAQIYLRGLLLEGRRKSCQPLAERLPDGDTQSVQQCVNQSPWCWPPVRAAIAQRMTAALGTGGCWIVDDTGFPKQGRHSVGVARQYSGTLGKTGNCQIGVSLSYATSNGAMPLEWALYLPSAWVEDRARCERVGVPAAVRFQTKWQLALSLMDRLLAEELPRPEVVVADADYGSVTEFRQGLTERKLRFTVEVEHKLAAWREPQAGAAGVRPESVKAIALSLPASAWRTVTWREGSKGKMRSRFSRLRVQPAHGWHQGKVTLAVVWLLIEWPEGAEAPSKYWLSDLPAATPLRTLVRWAKSRWAVEMNYREMKDHLGLDHFEGRGYVGWHHHVTLVMLAFAFLLSERLYRKKGESYRAFPRS